MNQELKKALCIQFLVYIKEYNSSISKWGKRTRQSMEMNVRDLCLLQVHHALLIHIPNQNAIILSFSNVSFIFIVWLTDLIIVHWWLQAILTPQRYRRTSNHALIFLATSPNLRLFRGLLATKDTLITKEIPRGWKALLQDRGQRPNTTHITSQPH